MIAILKSKDLINHLPVPLNLRFHRSASSRLASLVTPVPLFGKVYNGYLGTISAAEAIYKRPRAKPQTPAMQIAEKERDGVTKLIFHTVADRLKFSLDEAAKSAAAVIMPLLNNYKNLEDDDVESETEKIDNLVTELLDHPAELTTLGIINDVNFLRTKNLEYQAKYEIRMDYSEDARMKGTSKKHKTAMNVAFGKVTAGIYGLQLLLDDEDQLEALDDAAKSINAVINQYTIIQNQHEGRLKHDDSDVDEETETDETPEDKVGRIDEETVTGNDQDN
jgi:O-acetyl-ADP-ribose deacetylase (regulator of RNase III)